MGVACPKQILMGVGKFTQSEGFVLTKFQQARTARPRVCTLALLLRFIVRYFLHLFQVSNDLTQERFQLARTWFEASGL